jgi:hypothetical protein
VEALFRVCLPVEFDIANPLASKDARDGTVKLDSSGNKISALAGMFLNFRHQKSSEDLELTARLPFSETTMPGMMGTLKRSLLQNRTIGEAAGVLERKQREERIFISYFCVSCLCLVYGVGRLAESVHPISI